MHPQTLRIYETKGLVRPGRTPGGTRLYSERDLERLRADPAADDRARAQPRRRRARARARGRARASCARASTGSSARCARRSSRCTASTGARSSSTASTSAVPGQEAALMDFNKLTIKSQEAVAAAQERARRLGNPELYPEHLLLALLDQELPRALVGSAQTRCAPRPRRSSRRSRALEGAQQQPRRVGRALEGARPRGRRGAEARGRVRLDRAPAARARRRPARRAAREDQGGPRRPARHVPGSRRAPTRRSRSSAAT